jgi:hypothetical protein
MSIKCIIVSLIIFETGERSRELSWVNVNCEAESIEYTEMI